MARLAKLIEWDIPDVIDMNWEGKGFTRYSNVLINYMLTELEPSELKVFLLLSSNAYGGYRLPREMAVLRTGLSQSEYYRARKGLENKGWISLIEGTNPKIIINLTYIKELVMSHNNEPEAREIESE